MNQALKIKLQRLTVRAILVVLVPVSAVMVVVDPLCRALNAARKVFLNHFEDQCAEIYATYARLWNAPVKAEVVEETKLEEYGV